MYHVSCIMYHVSCVMCHVSCIMCHVSCVMYHVSCIMYRLWRVPATLPYPDLIFTTRTLPGKVLEISGFMLVTIHAVSTQDDQWCQLFSFGGKGFSFIIPLYTGFRNMQVTICQKHSSWTNITTSCNYDCNFEVFTLFCRTASEIFHSIIWEFLSQFTNFLVITLLEKF